ncbi:hypothetical protein BT63DRAFT_437663 [Microthyrium microscopicum]|uniref:Uncharacterized protein n=1 Tax=Microthyrium microscopicum TaxID=703497 RepID=A0A6A6UHN3_9PEZI|nr:hypothetical protein BT63DRAFT_437663 [Microthyrium microscopicum]
MTSISSPKVEDELEKQKKFSPSTSKKACFLGIPTELRCEIYKKYFEKIASQERYTSQVPQVFDEANALFLVSKQVYNESRDLFRSHILRPPMKAFDLFADSWPDFKKTFRRIPRPLWSQPNCEFNVQLCILNSPKSGNNYPIAKILNVIACDLGFESHVELARVSPLYTDIYSQLRVHQKRIYEMDGGEGCTLDFKVETHSELCDWEYVHIQGELKDILKIRCLEQILEIED